MTFRQRSAPRGPRNERAAHQSPGWLPAAGITEEGDVSNTRPNCYECIHRRAVPGDEHSSCENSEANVVGNANARRNGWFMWPYNFDPLWLLSCDGFHASVTKEVPA